jgi:hypothetical protein
MQNLARLILVPFALAACGDDTGTPVGSGRDMTTGATTTAATTTSTTVSASTAGSTATASSGGDGGNATGGEGGGGQGGSGNGGSGDGGSGVGGSGDGGSGVGGSGEGGSGEGGSTGTGDPLDCAVCVATDCPQIAECISDPVCADGMVCTLTTCIVDGQPDLGCIADCFDGDFAAALGALEALGCIVTTCGESCGGLIPAG